MWSNAEFPDLRNNHTFFNVRYTRHIRIEAASAISEFMKAATAAAADVCITPRLDRRQYARRQLVYKSEPVQMAHENILRSEWSGDKILFPFYSRLCTPTTKRKPIGSTRPK
ncbi:hypothetical protein TcasGA2_TC012940 [Tribolium castaneum]|uniref:Uncharacterized protein n=1 Tax=Tribolium castaneum TaxID=7070 RepID=D7EKA5_TRICA|nr:hypothetical protein TcasGA2_TC012940 [Tribolium castaneum]